MHDDEYNKRGNKRKNQFAKKQEKVVLRSR
jgi:hypothetical protein